MKCYYSTYTYSYQFFNYYIMTYTFKVSMYTATYTSTTDAEVNQYPITQLKIYTIVHITPTQFVTITLL